MQSGSLSRPLSIDNVTNVYGINPICGNTKYLVSASVKVGVACLDAGIIYMDYNFVSSSLNWGATLDTYTTSTQFNNIFYSGSIISSMSVSTYNR